MDCAAIYIYIPGNSNFSIIIVKLSNLIKKKSPSISILRDVFCIQNKNVLFRNRFDEEFPIVREE